MRLRRFIGVCLTLAGLGYWLARTRPFEEPPPKALPRAEVVIARLPSPKLSGPHASGAPHSDQISIPREQLTDVVFENRDGLAVAWGDVILGQMGPDFKREGGTTQISPPGRWPSPKIPYVISPQLPHPERVREAAETLARESAAQLYEVPVDQSIAELDLLVFEPTPAPPGSPGSSRSTEVSSTQVCLSALGRTGGAQPIRLAPGCGVPEVLHEILHSLGFIHEHSRADRDAYIEVHWERIDPLYQRQFGIVPLEWMGALAGTRFDPQSIMLYSSDLFSTRPGLPAITLRPSGALIPPATRLSEEDRARIARLWN